MAKKAATRRPPPPPAIPAGWPASPDGPGFYWMYNPTWPDPLTVGRVYTDDQGVLTVNALRPVVFALTCSVAEVGPCGWRKIEEPSVD